MARPKVFDYDAQSKEEIITAGVEGAALTWFGMDIDRQIIHIVCDEGTLNATGDGIKTVTRRGQQETLDASDTIAFYQANKAAIDSIVSAALETWASRRSKSGVVVES